MSLTKAITNRVTKKVTFLKKYSIRYYTGGVKIAHWNELSEEQKDTALSKDWCICWSYRHNGKLVRQDNIKGGVNRLKTKEERMALLKVLKKELVDILDEGFNPYDPNSIAIGKEQEPQVISIREAIKMVLELWKSTLVQTSYIVYESQIKNFDKWLNEKGIVQKKINKINKKLILEYLNDKLKRTSPRNRNNILGILSSFFSLLVSNEIIATNPAEKIKKLPVKNKRNKTYSSEQFNEIFRYLEQNNQTLLLFIKFVSYNFLRPVEVCRLKIGDINFKEKSLTVKAKNKPRKVKIIPELLFNEIGFLAELPPQFYLFTKNGPGETDKTPNKRREYFAYEFLKVKKALGLGRDYTIYSFRHTFITKLYIQLRKTATPFEAKSHLMLITGHSSMSSLEQYLRDIDAELPEDYSHLLK